jgi:hypothetical protein
VEAAERHHAASREAVGGHGIVTADLWLASGEAMFAARRGDLEHARQAALEAVDPAHATNDRLIEAFPVMVLAAIELWAGMAQQAHDRLDAIRESLIAKGFGFLGALTAELWSTRRGPDHPRSSP